MPFDGAFSPLHIMIIAVVALVVLGPEQLPKVARQLGLGIRELRRAHDHLSRELRDVVSEFDTQSATEIPRGDSPPILPPAEPHDT